MNKKIDAIELGMYTVSWMGRANHPDLKMHFDISHKTLIDVYLKKIGLIDTVIPVGDSSERMDFIIEIRTRLELLDKQLLYSYNIGTILQISDAKIDEYKDQLISLGTKAGFDIDWLDNFISKIIITKEKDRKKVLLEELIKYREESKFIPRSENNEYDFFISHASEDKNDIVRSLADALKRKGFKVWFDEFELKIGDSLRKKIDYGLRNSKYGIVIISPSFFMKNWTEFELNALVAREMEGKKIILPIWHNISKEQVLKFSPILADKLALNTSVHTIDYIVNSLNEL